MKELHVLVERRRGVEDYRKFVDVYNLPYAIKEIWADAEDAIVQWKNAPELVTRVLLPALEETRQCSARPLDPLEWHWRLTFLEDNDILGEHEYYAWDLCSMFPRLYVKQD